MGRTELKITIGIFDEYDEVIEIISRDLMCICGNEAYYSCEDNIRLIEINSKFIDIDKIKKKYGNDATLKLLLEKN